MAQRPRIQLPSGLSLGVDRNAALLESQKTLTQAYVEPMLELGVATAERFVLQRVLPLTCVVVNDVV